MDRTSLNAWVACLLDAGAAPGTARIRQLAVRRFAAWLIAAGHLAADPFLGVRAPKLDQPVVDPLTDDELRALTQTCAVPDHSRLEEPLHHRRDEAIIRLMLETAIRAGEVVALQTGDVDLAGGLVTIRRGKGGTGRIVPIGPAATLSLSQYLTLRRQHPLAESRDLWLGSHGKRSATTAWAALFAGAPSVLASRASARTGSAIPPPIEGLPRAVPNRG